MTEELEMTKGDLFFDCPQCGEIGLASKMAEHATRPMPEDLGFCPECHAPIDELISEREVHILLVEYGENADARILEMREQA